MVLFLTDTTEEALHKTVDEHGHPPCAVEHGTLRGCHQLAESLWDLRDFRVEQSPEQYV